MSHFSEPSVEEILESIKKVIARDNRAEAARERVRHGSVAEAGATAAGAQAGDAPVVESESAARSGNRSDFFSHEVLDLSELATHVLDDEHGNHNSKGSGMNDKDDTPLLPETTTASMRESLTALAMMSAPGATPQIVRSGETSLEGLVRELLRPQLAEWLDRNLPPMVEKLVASEIARIVGRKG